MKKSTMPMLLGLLLCGSAFAAEPKLEGELIFPLEDWHNHGSCVVKAPNGDIIVCWFHGSGERKEDDVLIRGARKVAATGKWTEPFEMADVPGFPDTNCCMIIDRQDRLWLLWPTILAHSWESALMKYKVSSDYMTDPGAPKWDFQEVLHMKPGNDFPDLVRAKTEAYLASFNMKPEGRIQEWIDHNYKQADDELTRRLGWFTRAHPKILDDGRMLVGLYSDGFSFSLVAITDDLGKSWQFSEPLVGGGNIQPTFATKKDGTVVAYMRDNGPPPKRVHVAESKDRGMTWGPVYDHPSLPNPGAGLEVINLADGDWAVIYNDLMDGRHSLAVSISGDDGATWKWTRHLEQREKGAGSFHYPSIMQDKDGMLHASYSYFIENDSPEESKGKSIKYVAFNKEWVMAGD
ncbi:MAG: exo-alpha-sialidase [Candidatus Hydrogenedentes bacterium]|nr:exo-alpha-sialidase [Candidatus Hydrogenedentota bacterium]